MSTDTRRFVALFTALALFNMLAWVVFVDRGGPRTLSPSMLVGAGEPAAPSVHARDETVDETTKEDHAAAPEPRFARAVLASTGSAHVEVELHFDAPLPVDAIAQVARFRDGRATTALSIEPLATAPTSVHRVRVPRPRSDELRVGVLSGGSETVTTLRLPHRFALLGTGDVRVVRGEAATAYLRFSRPLATETEDRERLATIRLEPAVDGLTITAHSTQLALRGAFVPGVSYRVHLPPTIRSANGESLVADGDATGDADGDMNGADMLVATITTRPPDPEIRLPDGSGILSPEGLRRLVVETVDVPAVSVRAVRIHDDLLVPLLRGLRADDAGRAVATKRFTIDAPPHTRHRTTLDLADLMGDLPGDGRGLYVISVADSRSRWLADQTTVSLTDLAPVVRTTRDGVVVWTTGVSDAAPKAGAMAIAYGRAGRVLAEARADDDGVASLSFRPDHPDGPLAAIVVRDGDDLVFVQTQRGGTPPAEVDGAGRPDPEGLDLLLFAERGVHRPGETIHITGLLRAAIRESQREAQREAQPAAGRDADIWPRVLPPTLQIALTLEGPDGRTLVETTAIARRADEGFLSVALPTPAAGATGTHRLVARLPGSEQVLATLTLRVEPFVPATMTARVEFLDESSSVDAMSTETATTGAVVIAERIGGGAVRDARVVARGRITPMRPRPAGFDDFIFGAPPAIMSLPLEVLSNTGTDDDGRCELTVPTPIAGRLDLTVSLTEPAGRTITATAPSRLVGYGGTVLGVRLGAGASGDADELRRTHGHTDMTVVTAERPIALATVLLTELAADGRSTAAPPSAEVEDEADEPHAFVGAIERVEHDWVAEWSAGAVVWRSHEHTVPVRDLLLPAGTIGAASTIDLPPLPPGRYRLSLHDPATDSRCGFDFLVAGVDDEGTPERPDRVELALADANRAVVGGAEADVVVRAPFAGRALFTIETSRVHAAIVRDVPAGTSVVTLPIPATLDGSPTLTVVVVRGVDRNAPTWRPHRAVGALRLPLDTSVHRLSVRIEADSPVEPGATATIRGRVVAGEGVLANAVVCVWAVDEGVLQAAAWETPDPRLHFHGPRRHAVRHFDARASLLPDHAGLLGYDRIGGDLAVLGRPGRRLSSHRGVDESIDAPHAIVIAPILVRTDADGRFERSFQMPAVDGALRVMAVAAAGTRYGRAEHEIVPDRAMRMLVTMPRAAAPGDSVETAIRIVNERDQPIRGTVFVDGRPIASDLEFLPATEVRLPLTLDAAFGSAALDASVQVIAEDGSVLAERTASAPIRAVAPRALVTGRIRLEPGESITIDAPSGFDPDDLVRRVVAGSGVAAEFDRLVEFLIDYPYGCAEQTISRLRGLVAVATTRPDHRPRIAPLVDHGLTRLRELQSTRGGIAYWPGDTRDDVMATVLAGRLVEAAREAGFEAPSGLRDGLIRALDAIVRDAAYSEPAVRAMAAESLVALDGPRRAWIELLAHDLEALVGISDGEPAAALAMAALESEMAPTALRIVEAIERASAESRAEQRLRFTSPTTAAAARLRILRALDISIDRRDMLEELLLDRAASQILTTADAAAILTALSTPSAASLLDAPLLDADTASLATAGPLRLFVDGEPLEAEDGATILRAELHSDRSLTLAAPADGPPLRIVITHDGRMRGDGVGAAAGASAQGLRLSRRWLDRENTPLPLEPSGEPLTVQAGDLIHVELTLSTDDGAAVDDIVIADLLPGGFEIEHPGLAQTSPDGGLRLEGARRAEIRDDRMIVFVDARERPATIRYAIRAVVPGTYTIPPTTAEAMYDPRRRATTGGGMVRVER